MSDKQEQGLWVLYSPGWNYENQEWHSADEVTVTKYKAGDTKAYRTRVKDKNKKAEQIITYEEIDMTLDSYIAEQIAKHTPKEKPLLDLPDVTLPPGTPGMI